MLIVGDDIFLIRSTSYYWAIIVFNTNEILVSKVQSIFFLNLTPFDLNSVVFPANVTLTNQCSPAKDFGPNNPATGGYPKWETLGCSQVAASYIDQVFEDVEDACFQIIRHWTVIDWCTFDLANTSTIKTHQQVIKVIDTEKPVINCEPKTFYVSSNCNANIQVLGQGSDSCTPSENLSYSYSLDTNNDQVYESSGSSRIFNTQLSIGTYHLRWVVEDKCGNSASCIQEIIVRDTIKPSVYCLSEITTVLMPSTLTVGLWAKDYNHGATDNCTQKVKFTFGDNPPVNFAIPHYYKKVNGVSVIATEAEYLNKQAEFWDPVLCSSAKIFDCDDLGLKAVTIYSWDDSGNSDYCTVRLNIQDNTGNCGLSRMAKAEGEILSLTGEPMQDINMIFQEAISQETAVTITDGDGMYFKNGFFTDYQYSVKGFKDTDYLNGVSTLDLVMIQRHILGIQPLTNPYLELAADINNDKKVTASDLVELRKVILGQTNSFKNNTSWKFILNSENNTSLSPWQMEEKAFFLAKEEKLFINDFTGIKIGDVSNDAKANTSSNQVQSRNAKTVLNVQDVTHDSDEFTRLAVKANDLIDVHGIQAKLIINKLTTVIGIESGKLDMSKENFNVLASNKNNIVKLSWNSMESTSIHPDEVLFTLVFNNKTDLDINELLSWSEEDMYNEVVLEGLQTSNLRLSYSKTPISENEISTLKVYQNVPNPFSDRTIIKYTLPYNDMVDIKITDTEGRVIMQRKESKVAGDHEIVISRSLLENRYGILLLNVSTSKETETIKMILMD